jgi:hypothetical protein
MTRYVSFRFPPPRFFGFWVSLNIVYCVVACADSDVAGSALPTTVCGSRPGAAEGVQESGAALARDSTREREMHGRTRSVRHSLRKTVGRYLVTDSFGSFAQVEDAGEASGAGIDRFGWT